VLIDMLFGNLKFTLPLGETVDPQRLERQLRPQVQYTP
jgi:hypothetical protein